MPKLLSDKNFSLTSSNLVADICNPLLNRFNITYFDHYRMFRDGTCAILCNNSAWTEHFFKQGYAIPSVDEYPKSGIFLWAGIQALQTYDKQVHDAKEHFNIDSGITFIEAHNDYYDMFNFATYTGNTPIINFYINNRDLLVNFIHRFKTNAYDLVKKAILYKHAIPVRPLIINSDTFSTANKAKIPKNLSRNHCQKSARLLGITGNVLLTKREADCLNLLQKGFSAKEIGYALNLSHRTVEHYLESLRQKFNCHSKRQLLKKLENQIFLISS